ncbi:MAG: hypothetical protein EU539_02470 [Promethearchaeota archaeon]|nr:MAG: hypothetical protein EU539_02470 [Candidatus Lokiarchaeota archaeon]
MVIIIQRLIQRVYSGKWEDLEKIDKKYTELENKMGFPAKKRYRVLTGAHDNNTIIIERQWQSLAQFEKLHTKAFLDPEYQKLDETLESIIEISYQELLVPHPPFPE